MVFKFHNKITNIYHDHRHKLHADTLKPRKRTHLVEAGGRGLTRALIPSGEQNKPVGGFEEEEYEVKPLDPSPSPSQNPSQNPSLNPSQHTQMAGMN